MGEKTAVALLSGGLDSMVAAALAKESGYEILALTLDYNQRHRVELSAARRIAAALNVRKHVVFPLDLRTFGGSALTSELDVPKGGLGGDIPVTYVPARNTVFLSLALAWAETESARALVIGVNALDYSGYPDCRPEFIQSFEQTANVATKAGVEGTPFRVLAPLQNLAKAEIVREAARLGLDTSLSWSCYDPVGDKHCGLCDSCRLRASGYEMAGIVDPTTYASPSPAAKPLD